MKFADAEKLDQIGEHAEVGVGHQLPHQRGDRRRGHERQKKENRHQIVDPGLLLQQHRDGQAKHQLDADREHGIFERHLHGVPEFPVRKKLDVVLKPDESPHHRQVQTIALKRIIDGGDERNQDADADEQRRQAEQVRQVVDPSAPRGSVGALDCGVGHEANLARRPLRVAAPGKRNVRPNRRGALRRQVELARRTGADGLSRAPRP